MGGGDWRKASAVLGTFQLFSASEKSLDSMATETEDEYSGAALRGVRYNQEVKKYPKHARQQHTLNDHASSK
jgi:hypothetical protein